MSEVLGQLCSCFAHFGLVAAIAATAACGGGAASPSVAGHGSASPAATTATGTPVAVSDLPITVTHAQVLSLFAYDTSKPLDVKDVTAPKTTDGVTVRDISYASSSGSTVSAWLVVPSGSGPFAAVLYLHWLSGLARLVATATSS